MSETQVQKLADNYVTAVVRVREAAKRVKEMREQKDELGQDLLEVLQEEQVDIVRLPNGYSVKRVTREKRETRNEDVIVEGLTQFLDGGGNDDSKAASERAVEALEQIEGCRQVEDVTRLSVAKPKKATAVKAARGRPAKRQRPSEAVKI